MAFALVERGGRTRAEHITSGCELHQTKYHLQENVSPKAHLAPDEASMYWKLGKQYTGHLSVNHSYVNGDASTNTMRSCLRGLKRIGAGRTFRSSYC